MHVLCWHKKETYPVKYRVNQGEIWNYSESYIQPPKKLGRGVRDCFPEETFDKCFDSGALCENKTMSRKARFQGKAPIIHKIE